MMMMMMMTLLQLVAWMRTVHRGETLTWMIWMKMHITPTPSPKFQAKVMLTMLEGLMQVL